MTAVMGDDERSNQKASGENRKMNCQPPGDLEAEVNETPKCCVRNQCVHQLPDARPNSSLLIFGDNFFPRGRLCLGPCVGGPRFIHHILSNFPKGLPKEGAANSCMRPFRWPKLIPYD